MRCSLYHNNMCHLASWMKSKVYGILTGGNNFVNLAYRKPGGSFIGLKMQKTTF